MNKEVKQPKVYEQLDLDLPKTTRFQMTEEDEKNAKLWTGVRPLIGRNFLSLVVTDIINIFANPGWVSLISFFVNLVHFFASSLVGGFVGAMTFVSFE